MKKTASHHHGHRGAANVISRTLQGRAGGGVSWEIGRPRGPSVQ